jgi:Cu/Ag efflux protein CusF
MREPVQDMMGMGDDTIDNMMDMSAMGGSMAPKQVNDNQAWVKGKVLNIMTDSAKLELQHEAIKSWGWPEMKMDFPVDKALNIAIFDKDEDYNFLIEKHSSGSIKIIDFNKKVAP